MNIILQPFFLENIKDRKKGNWYSVALKIKSFGLFGDTPTNYADYSSYIYPILPSGYKSISHNSDAMSKITVDHVMNCVSNYI